jgi:hypothetical protein
MRLILFVLLTRLFTPEPAPLLTLTLRDAAGTPVSGVTVIVRDTSGQRELSRAITDADGLARIPTLPVTEVRVLVTGTLPDGTALALPGSDRDGIVIYLTGTPTTRLQWRVQADGMVTPDPLTEITGATAPLTADTSVAADTPAVPEASPVVPVEPPVPVAQAPVGAAGQPPAPASPEGTLPWGGYVVIGVLVIGIGVLVLLQRRGW